MAARPSQGKTALAMQMCQAVAKQIQATGDNGCVAIFSAEMAGWSLYLRMASALSGVNIHNFRKGKGKPEDKRKLESAMRDLRDVPIWIDDNSGPTTGQMLEQLTELNEAVPVRAMMFDFMELGGDRKDSEEQRLSQITHNLKAIAKTLEIPVLALSQLNRSVENRGNKMPGLADLRYSGMIEQLADQVLFIMRPEYYAERGMQVDVPERDKKGVAYVQIAKNRNGPVGLVRLAFMAEQSKFADVTFDKYDLED
jgi:replicative DNA helicase